VIASFADGARQEEELAGSLLGFFQTKVEVEVDQNYYLDRHLQ
jgi:hypothetical protein